MKCIEIKPFEIMKRLLPLAALAAIAIVTAAWIFIGNGELRPVMSAPEKKELNVLWADWQPSQALQPLSEDFTDQTGIKVKVMTGSWSTASSR